MFAPRKAARLGKLQRFARWVKLEVGREKRVDSDVLVFGDFNTEAPAMLQALLSEGLRVPDPLVGVKTILARTRHHDHLLHLPSFTQAFTNQGGVLDVVGEDNLAWFEGLAPARFSCELSDHFPVWACLRTDDDAEKLDQLIQRSGHR